MDQHGSKTSGISSADRAGLTECLQLLRGPSDERRFVGLLLATNMLPAGDEHVMLSVYEAVGSLFISRLLRPLQIPQTSRSNHEDGQKAAAAAGLGLAVLAGLSTVPRLAVAADFVEKVPLLLKVIREGGINPVVNNDRSEAQSAASDAQSANDHAVSDAMECLVHIARASNEGTAVTLQSRGLSAAAQALHNGVTLNAAWKVRAVELLGLLLSGPQREDLPVAEAPGAILQAVPGLARLLKGGPLQAPSEKQASEASVKSPAEVQSQSLLQCDAALQLQALQVLLLFLPLPVPQAEEAASALRTMAAAEGEGWAADVRSGLYNILVSRTGQQQRHCALHLAAAALELAQPQWLLGPIQPATAAASFFQVLVEILKVEISLLLNDALSIMHASSTSTVEPSRKSAEPINASPLQPKAQMPLAPPAHSPSKASSAAPDSRYKAGLPHAAQSSTDNSKPTGNSTADPSSSWSGALPDSNHTKIGISPETSSEKTPEGLLVEEATQDGKRQRDDHTTSPAEARVTGVLPAVFSLMEGCLQALAADAQAAEDTQGGSRLDDKVSQRAMQALSEAFETVLQFLELVHAEGLGQESPWVLAAVRAVGSFMAEVPHAHASRLQALLVWLVQCQSGAALPFLLPGLLLCSQTGNEDLDFGQPATHKRWHEALLQPEVVSAVVQYLCRSSNQTRAALHSTSQAAAEDAQAELSAVVSLLTATVAPQPTLQLSQVIDGHILQLVKPAVTALNLCRAAWQQTPDHNLDISFGLAAAVGLQCALTLVAAQAPSIADSQDQELWSASEAAETFETVLWALSWYNEVLCSGPDSVANAMQQLELDEGNSNMQIALGSWDAVLDAATTLVVSNLGYRQQACKDAWVKQGFKHDQRNHSTSFRMFIQTCLG